jgi:gas vesicle protein
VEVRIMYKLLVGIVLGLGVGAAIALLYAPLSGEELRAKLQEHDRVVLEEAVPEDSEPEAKAAA